MPKMVKRFKRRRAGSGSPAAPKANPPLFTELLEFVGPGFGGFAVTRFATRVASTQVAKRWPKIGKHAGAAASVGSFLSAWFLAHRWKLISKYHTPIVVGSAIAAIQSLIQIYIPALGWIVSDASPEIKQLATSSNQLQQRMPEPEVEDGFEIIDDSGWRSYNDAGSLGRYARPTQQRPPQPVAASPAEDAEDDVWAGLEDDDDLQSANAFGGS